MVEFYEVFVSSIKDKSVTVIGLLGYENGEFAIYVYPDRLDKVYWLPQLFGLHRDEQPTSDRIKLWIKNRAIPPTRVNIRECLDALGLQKYDAWEIMKKCNGENPGQDHWGFSRTDNPNPDWVEKLQFII